jgi:aspartyl-tRNA(Asn)/glutamyl-tRNA(Gln) amidotransferase subunit A
MSEGRQVTRRSLLFGLGGRLRARSDPPAAADGPARYSLAAAARNVATGELSPVDLMRTALAQIARAEPSRRAFVTRVDVERCMDLARQAEYDIEMGGYHGRLHGIPLVVPDSLAVEGVRQEAGAPHLQRWVPTADATVVRRLREAGAIIVGKTAVADWGLAHGSLAVHDLTHPEGGVTGTDGGAAAAVAAHFALAATGTDTSGGLRSSALACGLVGLKPTYGRVSRSGVTGVSLSLDHVGCIAARAEDAALLLGAIAGPDPADPATMANRTTPDFTAGLSRGIEGWTIGLAPADVVSAASPDALAAFASAVGVFRGLGCTLCDVSLPDMRLVAAAHRIVEIVEAAAYHRELLRRPPETYDPDNGVRLRLIAGSLLPEAAYERAQQVRTAVTEELGTALAEVDVLLTPGWRSDDPAPPWATLFNLTGFPAIVVPSAVEDHPGAGIQIAGRPFEEQTILTAAHSYEFAARR